MLPRLVFLLLWGLNGTACHLSREADVSVDPRDPVMELETLETLETEALLAWQDRENPQKLARALTIWAEFYANNTLPEQLVVNLPRGYHLQGNYLLKDSRKTEAKKAFEKGVMTAEKAIMEASEEFAARIRAGEKVRDAISLLSLAEQPLLYWYAANLGQFAALSGFTALIFYKDRIVSVMTKVLNLDETFYYGAPHRFFGAYYSKAPGFAGGDLVKAKEHFEKAIALAPDFVENQLVYAEFFAVKSQEKELFVSLLNEVLAGDPTSIQQVEPEQRFAQERARQLLAQQNLIF